MRKPKTYPSDPTPKEWAVIEPLLRRALYGRKPKPLGAPRKYSLYDLTRARLSVLRNGIHRRELPHDLPPDGLLPLPSLAAVRGLGAGRTRLSRPRPSAGALWLAEVRGGGQPECAHHAQRGARGYDGGKKIKGRKRPIVVDSQGSVLAVLVTPARVSDAQGGYEVLDAVLTRYRSVQVVIADSAYDREGLLEWSLGKWEVGLACVGRSGGKGFVGSSRRWLVERRFGWLLRCRRLSWCYDVLCAVEAAWLWLAGVRWLMRRIARNTS